MKDKTIGQRIRRERKRQGLTMAQLGERMGISGSLVGRYERDKENPKIETIKRFADALDIPISELCPDLENAQRKEPAMNDLHELMGCIGRLNDPWWNDSCLRDALGHALGGLEEFASVWDGVLTDPHGPFSTEQVETLAQINETASIWLNGWDAAALVLTGGEGHE